jgi:hypothetical protein
MRAERDYKMTPNIKKIIAREGLVIIGSIIVLALIGLVLFAITRNSEWFGVILIIVYLYPIYLLVRFIIWAIRTLRER